MPLIMGLAKVVDLTLLTLTDGSPEERARVLAHIGEFAAKYEAGGFDQ